MKNRDSAKRPDVFLYDTTLRDGTQQQGISLTLKDKLKCAQLLDAFGMHYIEGGWPGSNPKDSEFFQQIKECELQNATVTAFGSTRRAQSTVKQDKNLLALLDADTPAVTLVGKSSRLHVQHILETELEENLRMISESVQYMKDHGKEVIYDAEHFFDGFFEDPNYCLSTLQAAAEAGADWLVLCDTNGGTLPQKVAEVTAQIIEQFQVPVGIHTHNDCETAVANSLAAVAVGATQVQGTVNGYGERCGNANLISLIPSLQMKMGYQCVDDDCLQQLTGLAQSISELANRKLDSQAAYVGSSAFAHKGGLHVAAVEKRSESYEHIPPTVVGNKRGSVISELSGRGNVRVLAESCGLNLDGAEIAVLGRIKELENQGYQFESAEGSVELLIRKNDASYRSPFLVEEFIVVSEQRKGPRHIVEAIVKVSIGGTLIQTSAEGDGPLHALDTALRKALLPEFPELNKVHLSDYKVRILDPDSATSAITRVSIEASQGNDSWTTIGCSKNVIDASFMALVESYELFLHRCRADQSESHSATI